jgi:hypothetical protein
MLRVPTPPPNLSTVTARCNAGLHAALDSLPGRCHLRAVAVRSDYRPVPEMGLPARIARAFAYVLLVVTCTVIAALGGYQVGVRSSPTEAVSAARREHAVRTAVTRAVAARAAHDRALRRTALARAMRWQRARLETEFARRLGEQHLADAAMAERAYRRGRAAGRARPAGTEKAKAPR